MDYVRGCTGPERVLDSSLVALLKTCPPVEKPRHETTFKSVLSSAKARCLSGLQ